MQGTWFYEREVCCQYAHLGDVLYAAMQILIRWQVLIYYRCSNGIGAANHDIYRILLKRWRV